jgi:alkaline phosphatase
VSFSAAEAARALSAEGGDSERVGATKVPLFDAADIDQLWQAYRPSERDRVSAMASRALDDRRGVVWATGTHTHTPVPLVVVGPTGFAPGLARLTHHVQVGEALFSWLGLPGPQEP